MPLTEKELQVFTHKIRNMLSFNNEDLEEIKKMTSEELLIILLVLNEMFECCINIFESY